MIKLRTLGWEGYLDYPGDTEIHVYPYNGEAEGDLGSPTEKRT